MADNVDVIEKLWEAFSAGDMEKAAARFAPDGSVLQGPAVHRLERKPLD